MANCGTCNHREVCRCFPNPEEYCCDFEPERPHGKWAKTDDDLKISDYRCSVCGQLTDLDEPWNFCPNCGADMRKEGDTNDQL